VEEGDGDSVVSVCISLILQLYLLASWFFSMITVEPFELLSLNFQGIVLLLEIIRYWLCFAARVVI